MKMIRKRLLLLKIKIHSSIEFVSMVYFKLIMQLVNQKDRKYILNLILVNKSLEKRKIIWRVRLSAIK